ncbi:MAG: ABC transporter substrate-binding protein [Lachnospiraceae bacterium]|nr:ABC transporter substrate-binding protein [Lachnospiraceae bacterium]MBR3684337.1 ABC transporter substrate-binding protein [Lachnospiraceae bacterium]
MKKRIFVLAMTLLISLGMMTACGKKEEAGTTVRVGSLKGPTSIGLTKLMQDDEDNKSEQDYEFTMETAADAISALIVQKELDIALVPANMASILYQKTEGKVAVIDINTLGVLYGVTGDDSITEISDLSGKTVYLTGKGTTPDFVLQYLLKENGIADSVKLEYKSEATEVAAVLKNDTSAIGILPQPFVTAACTQNEALNVVLDLTKEWSKLQGDSGSMMVTGVTIARTEWMEENPEQLTLFLKEHRASTEYVNSNVEAVAELVVKYGIIEKAPIAKKAIPECNITCMTGEDMKAALEGYLSVLYEQNPQSVGGKLPGETFYYIAE